MAKSKKKSPPYRYPKLEPAEHVQEEFGLEETKELHYITGRQRINIDMTDPSGGPLAQMAKALFNNANLSDVTICIHTHKHGATKLPAHSFVLAALSPYFKCALEGQFAESASKEFTFDQDSPHYSPHAYWRVFEYMYTMHYSDEPVKLEAFEDDDDDEELVRDVRVYCLAEYFSIDALKEHASEQFKSKVEQLWLSDRFSDCIRTVYQSTTKTGGLPLRNAVVLEVNKHITVLWAQQAFRELYREGGDFAEDVMDKKLDSQSFF